MNDRQKPAGSKVPEKAGQTPLPAQPQRPTEDQRWQRTVRFNWDKGGSKGGRK